jgi:excisionase family DNA binding protein
MKEPEIFDIVIAVNRLKDTLSKVEQKVDFLSKPLSEQLNRKYLTTDDAAKILKISPRTLAKIRADGSIPFIKVRRKIVYSATDLEGYLLSNCKQG